VTDASVSEHGDNGEVRPSVNKGAVLEDKIVDEKDKELTVATQEASRNLRLLRHQDMPARVGGEQ
jgi:hypothetical protein